MAGAGNLSAVGGGGSDRLIASGTGTLTLTDRGLTIVPGGDQPTLFIPLRNSPTSRCGPTAGPPSPTPRPTAPGPC